MLHARIEYESQLTAPAPAMHHEFVMSIQLDEPALRDGKGASAVYIVDNSGREQLAGSVRARGHAHIEADSGSLDETYDKSASWPARMTPSSGLFVFVTPTPSPLGTGLHLTLHLHAAVTGTGVATLNSRTGSTKTEPSFSVPFQCSASDKVISGEPEGCGVDLELDPAPRALGAGEHNDLLAETLQGLAQPGAEALLAMSGHYFGASTEYRADGHFIVRFRKSYESTVEDSKRAHQINFIAWSTGRNENWQPDGLPPLKPP